MSKRIHTIAIIFCAVYFVLLYMFFKTVGLVYKVLTFPLWSVSYNKATDLEHVNITSVTRNISTRQLIK